MEEEMEWARAGAEWGGQGGGGRAVGHLGVEKEEGEKSFSPATERTLSSSQQDPTL